MFAQQMEKTQHQPEKKKPAKKEPPKEKKNAGFSFSSRNVPTAAGCYLFFDEKDELLYVGKAKNLRKRVATYFQKNQKSPRTALMVGKIARLEVRVVNSEMEALILENNLIKQHRPRFNVLMRDDKNFLYLRVTPGAIPKIEITRRLVRDGSFYFGPKTSAKQFRATMNFCQKVFRIRTCNLTMEVGAEGKVKVLTNPENRKLPCMDFHLHRCSAPCTGEITPDEYAADLQMMKQFLRGQTKEILQGLQERMMGYAQEKNFEAAAKIRDLIASIEVSTQRQQAEFNDLVDRDFLNFVREGSRAFFVRIAFRGGKLLHQNEVELRAEEFIEDGVLVTQCLMQFYEKVDEMPREICIPVDMPQREETEQILSQKFSGGEKISLLVPQKGEKKRVMELAEKNARHFCEQKKLEELAKAENFANALPELAQVLSLPEPPRRIECVDISHYAGAHPVASLVVFQDGAPSPAQYRRFSVKTLPEGGIDDFASMKEIITRRFGRADDTKFAAALPDLLVLDGGKGQLSTVMKIFDEGEPPEGFDPHTQIIALAKREEQIFRPGEKDPLELPFTSSALKLLQRLRDEAHRFAISYNRNLRSKSATKSALDSVPGIGAATRKKLLQAFGSAAGVREADDEALSALLNKKQLEAVRRHL